MESYFIQGRGPFQIKEVLEGNSYLVQRYNCPDCVEKYHRFINKTQSIVGAELGTHHSFVENSKNSQYAWYSAPIDDTDIPRSLAAVGRHFKFPIDVKLTPDPSLNDENQSALYIYLRDVSIDSKFASSVL